VSLFEKSSRDLGTTHLDEAAGVGRTVCDKKRFLLCQNIKHFLSATDIDLDSVRTAVGLEPSEFDRAQRGIIIPLAQQKRILTYFGVDLALAGRENLGRVLGNVTRD
jgi:hypothetical protein